MIKNLNKEQIYNVIDKVAKNHKNKSFSYHTINDIEQQVWIIALERIKDFNHSKSKQKNIEKALEHWLNTVVSNRLANFYRDKYVVPHKQSNIISPISMDNKIDLEDKEDYFNNIVGSDYWDLVIKDLNDYYLDILECILSGEIVNSYYRSKLMNRIKVIMRDIKNA